MSTETNGTISLYRHRRPRYTDDLFEAFFGRTLDEHLAKKHAMDLAADEFWLNASFKGLSFVTTRNRAHKVAHIAMRSCTVWGRTPVGPQMRRVVAQGMCGQWVMRAVPVDWFRDEPQCARCVAELGRVMNEADKRKAAVA